MDKENKRLCTVRSLVSKRLYSLAPHLLKKKKKNSLETNILKVDNISKLLKVEYSIASNLFSAAYIY